MIFNVSGGGGAALNFRVVGGTTAPSNPAENCIWVNTNTPITSYVFSAEQPTGVPGMVWITTGTSSTVEFNALKKNGIQVYPISAKQYVSGAWVGKTAKSWQGGEWVDWWTGELYTPGNEWESVTGGWNVIKYGDYTGTLEKTSSSMKLTGTAIGWGAVCATKKINPIDLSKFSTLKINVLSWTPNSGGDAYLFVTSSNTTEGIGNSVTNVEKARQKITGSGVYSIDISEITDGYPIVFSFYGSLVFNKIWME